MQIQFRQLVYRLYDKRLLTYDYYPELPSCAQNHCKEARRVRVQVRQHEKECLPFASFGGTRGSQTEEYGWLLGAHKHKEMHAPLEPPLGTKLGQHFDLNRARPHPDF